MKNSVYFALTISILLVGQADAICNVNIQKSKPNDMYTDNHDGTVTDKVTRLTWSKCSFGQTWIDNTPNDPSDDTCSGTASPLNWMGALDAARSANSSNLLGQTDWRVPNAKEVETLVEKACYSPAINTYYFPSTMTGYYWTSTPAVISRPESAFAVSFTPSSMAAADGGVGPIHKDYTPAYLILVRGSY